ncbi:uncharacterized protein LOC128656429 [Bombina bombina]|uniref:uncharacterized protein LOC128656429 n=1 Tax=Bombina bombina TaxID=8345 RepID=UPI00235B2BE1|nr:uncharacterized protein LOC128656429 [Bombina bombina]
MGRPQKSSPTTKGSESNSENDVCTPKSAPAAQRSQPEKVCTPKTEPTPQRKRTPAVQGSRSASKDIQNSKASVGCATSTMKAPDVYGTRSREKLTTSRGGRTKSGVQYSITPQQVMEDSDPPSSSSSSCKPKSPPMSKPFSREDIANIEMETRGQRENPKWYSWRQNRITASMAHQISHSRFVNQQTEEIPRSYLNAVLGTGPRVQTAAMNWGIRNEKRAVQAFVKELSQREGRQIKVVDCGLFIHPEKDWLAASPDGLVYDGHTGEELGLLEVKCPYKHRDHTVREACADRNFCLTFDGDTYTLRKNHAYYTQVQCQLAATRQSSAHFVVHTNKETAIAHVNVDPKFWDETESKLEKFYQEAVIPCLKRKDGGSKGVMEHAMRAAEE